ncbi:MAG TPA: GNAT family N-acetyltransferase [Burkholderiaceae bacterium]
MTATLHTGTWAELGQAAAQVRTEVFVHEQGIPAAEEWDADDASAVHAVVLGPSGQPLATGRLLRHAPGVARIGRMAVCRPARGGKLGRMVLEALLECARQRGDHEVILHAQRYAEGFYARAGFAPYGEPFDEAGIAHIAMRRVL